MGQKFWQRIFLFELAIIAVFSIVPLFTELPYRVNIFLTWEGAYRMSKGQLPFKDFGTPIGGVFWVIPAVFMKLFGPGFLSLVKAQVLLNFIAALSFRSIVKSLGFDVVSRVVALFLFLVSYSFFNFWPWYNHSVIVYQLLASAFLLKFVMYIGDAKPSLFWILLSSVFITASFFTKQDGGALGLLILLIVVAYQSMVDKAFSGFFVFVFATIIFFGTYMLVFSQYGFGYWFNYGQAPHSARLSLGDIVKDIFEESAWIKFYFLMLVVLNINKFKNPRAFLSEKFDFIPILFVLGILCEAAVLQVTSYTPPDNNIFFHSFAGGYIFWCVRAMDRKGERDGLYLIVMMTGILIWWSPNYWRYAGRVFGTDISKAKTTSSPSGENVVNRDTYMLIQSGGKREDMSTWRESEFRTLKGIKMPEGTIEGIRRIKTMASGWPAKSPTVLNMTELTSLADEIPFDLERGSDYPLWFHLGVGMFNRQAEMFESRIKRNYYDLVLFEYVPGLNNFYPFRVRDTLRNHYDLVDHFIAPRRGETIGEIEVYRPRER